MVGVNFSNRVAFIIIILLFCISVYSYGGDPTTGHTPSEIAPGTFAGGGDYIFPSGSILRIGDTQINNNQINRYNDDELYLGYSTTSSVQSVAPFYAPFMYDRDDANYYLNPAEDSNLNRIFATDIRSNIFYDRDNAAYYANPAGTSYFNDIRASILYDRDDTGYYVNPAEDSYFDEVYAAAFWYTSDKSLKKDITPLENSLEKVKQLEGVSFKWKDNEEKDIGLIAQDVEKIFPELVSTNKETGLKSVEYGKLTAILIEAIKEQQKQIDELKEK